MVLEAWKLLVDLPPNVRLLLDPPHQALTQLVDKPSHDRISMDRDGWPWNSLPNSDMEWRPSMQPLRRPARDYCHLHYNSFCRNSLENDLLQFLTRIIHVKFWSLQSLPGPLASLPKSSTSFLPFISSRLPCSWEPQFTVVLSCK